MIIIVFHVFPMFVNRVSRKAYYFAITKMKILIFVSLLLLREENGFPLSDRSLESMAGERNEQVFPNGTVVGQYQYMDKDGNPVEVKYYADNSNYGVELNSLKVIQDKITEELITTTTLSPISKDTLLPGDTTANNMKYHPYDKKYKFNDPILEFLNKETAKSKHRSQKHSSDYETYMLEEDAKRCSKNKVRVYNMEPEKRKVRNTHGADLVFAENVCERL